MLRLQKKKKKKKFNVPAQWGQDAVALKVNILIVFVPYQKRCNSINVTSTLQPPGLKMNKNVQMHYCGKRASLWVCPQEVIPQDAASNEACATFSYSFAVESVFCGNCSDVLHDVSASDSSCRPSAAWWRRRGAAHHLSLSLAPSKMSQRVPGAPTHTRTQVNYAVIKVNGTVFSWRVHRGLSKMQPMKAQWLSLLKLNVCFSLWLAPCCCSAMLLLFSWTMYNDPLEPKHLVTQVKHLSIPRYPFSCTQAHGEAGVHPSCLGVKAVTPLDK